MSRWQDGDSSCTCLGGSFCTIQARAASRAAVLPLYQYVAGVFLTIEASLTLLNTVEAHLACLYLVHCTSVWLIYG